MVLGALRAELMNLKVQLLQAIETIDNFGKRIEVLEDMSARKTEPVFVRKLFGKGVFSSLDELNVSSNKKEKPEGSSVRISWEEEFNDVLSDGGGKSMKAICDAVCKNHPDISRRIIYNRISATLTVFVKRGFLWREGSLVGLNKKG